ncbi:MAG: hypothetical protein ABIP41_05740 [Croceibacterium sp.]
MKRIALAVAALAAATTAAPAAAQSACTRELLQGIADSWVGALTAGTPYGKMNLGEWVEFRQNLDSGFMSEFFDMTPKTVDWHNAMLDTTVCKAVVESVYQDKGQPRLIAAQLTNGFFGVSPIDVLVPAAATDTAAARAQFPTDTWGPIPETQRMDRAALITAANAYLADKQPDEVKNRQYVVDETLGLINVFAKLAGKPTSVTLRIEGGQVRAVHTLAV